MPTAHKQHLHKSGTAMLFVNIYSVHSYSRNTSPPAEEGCVWPILKGRLDEQELDTLPGPESDNAEAEQDTVPVILGSESTNIATSMTARPRVDLQDGSTTDNPHRVPLREPLPEPTNPVPINEDAFLLDAAPTRSGQLLRSPSVALVLH